MEFFFIDRPTTVAYANKLARIACAIVMHENR
jgi:hypothetical protein